MAEEEEKFHWDEQRVKDNELFRDVLNKTDVREKLFTEKFIEGLEKRRDALEIRSRKEDIIQLTVGLLLAVALVTPEMSVSLFGLSAKAGNFREILLLIMSSIHVHGAPPAIEQARITDAMHLYIQKQAADVIIGWVIQSHGCPNPG